MAENNNSMMYIVAIIAIVAIVGMVVLIMNSGTRTAASTTSYDTVDIVDEEGNVVGQVQKVPVTYYEKMYLAPKHYE